MKKQLTFFSEPNKPILDALYRPARGHDRKRKYVPRKRLNASSLNSAPASSARAGTSTVRRGSSTATLSNLFDGGLRKQTNAVGNKSERLAGCDAYVVFNRSLQPLWVWVMCAYTQTANTASRTCRLYTRNTDK